MFVAVAVFDGVGVFVAVAVFDGVGVLFLTLLPFFFDPPGFSISQARLPASNSRARSNVSNSTASPRLKVAFVSPSVT